MIEKTTKTAEMTKKSGKLDVMTIGERITELREKQNITKAELSRKAGLKQPMITNYESNFADPSAHVIVKLAEALNTSTDYLLTGQHPAGVDERIAQLSESEKRLVDELLELIQVKKEYNELAGHFKHLAKQST